jgi:hypothetical protein
MSTQMPSTTQHKMSLEVTFNQDTNNPSWNDDENDRLLWRAAEVRKLRRPATHCAGRRRIVRSAVKENSVTDNNFSDMWDGVAAQSCLGMIGSPMIFGMDAETMTHAEGDVVERGKSVRDNFQKEHALRRHQNSSKGRNSNKANKGRRLQQFQGRRDLCGAPNPNRS